MLNPLFNRGVEAIQSAKKESEFWLAFDSLSKKLSRYPHGLLVLWTPSVRMAALRIANGGGTVLEECIEQVEPKETPLRRRGTPPLWFTRELTVEKLGQIRRDVRAGNYVLSARGTDREWTMVADLRGKAHVFAEPMESDEQLGLARARSQHRPSIMVYPGESGSRPHPDEGDDRAPQADSLSPHGLAPMR